jgi:signal transduction histidine kinase
MVFDVERMLLAGIGVLVNLLCLLFASRVLSPGYPLQWADQLRGAIAALIALGLAQAVIREGKLRFLFLIFRLILVVAIALPLARSPSFLSAMAALLVLDAFVDFGQAAAFLCAAVVAGICAFAILTPVYLWGSPPPPVDPGQVGLGAIILIIATAVGGLFTRDRARLIARDRLIGELHETNLRLASANIRFQDVATDIELQTADRERSRIAREIHDSLAFTLTNVLALLNTNRERANSEGGRIPDELVQAREIIRDGLAELRDVLKTLRSDSGERVGGWDAIIRLIKVFRLATGVDVSLTFVNVPVETSRTVEEVLYHVVQEGLTNSFRHGKATAVEVSFAMDAAGGIELTIRDNGTGANETVGGFGLVGIRERVGELGGETRVSTSPGMGFSLKVEIPLTGGEAKTGTAE